MQGVTESDHENAQCDWAYRGCRVIDSSASRASPVTEHCRVILGQRCFPYRTTANSVERCRRSTKGISPRISRCSLRSHRRLRHWVVLQRLQLSSLLRTIELWIQWLRLSELLRTVLRVWLWAVLRRLWIFHRTPLQAGDFSASGVALLGAPGRPTLFTVWRSQRSMLWRKGHYWSQSVLRARKMLTTP